MKLLIIGGGGFIGKKVIDNCAKHECLVLVRNTINKSREQHKYIDTSKISEQSLRQALIEFEPDVCIDVAWEGIPDYSLEMMQKNINAKIDMINMLKTLNINKLIMCGTCWEYGNNKGEQIEEDIGTEVGLFGVTKKLIYELTKSALKGTDIDLVWARIFYSYGYGQRGKSLVPYIYEKLENNEEPTLKNKNGANDFIYINDVAEAITLMAEKDIKEGIYNIGTGKLTSNQYILDKIVSIMKKEKMVEKTKKENLERENSWAGTEKSRIELGWVARTEIDEGLEKMVNELRRNNDD